MQLVHVQTILPACFVCEGKYLSKIICPLKDKAADAFQACSKGVRDSNGDCSLAVANPG